MDDKAIKQLSDKVGHLERALESRDLIGQAKGILIARCGLDPDAAFRMMVDQSQHQNRKLVEVAAEIVQRAISGRIGR
jgi:AmiR/NasT family two-component response regulator